MAAMRRTACLGDAAFPPSWGGDEEGSGQQEGEQKQLVVGAFEDVLHAERDEACEPEPDAAVAEIDVGRVDVSGGRVLADRPDLAGGFDLAALPV
jgi:hypothetical protein